MTSGSEGVFTMRCHRYQLYSIAVFFVTVVICLFTVNMSETFSSQNRINENSPDGNIHEQEPSFAHLYFSDRTNSFLKAEDKKFSGLNDPLEFGKRIIEALISGPNGELMRTIPEKTRLRALHIKKDGTAYVDMSRELKDNHPGGIGSEIMTIYSIVNSLVLNIPEIDAVKILIDGKESITLAGHIDLKFPLKADMLLIR